MLEIAKNSAFPAGFEDIAGFHIRGFRVYP
jgi:hypothetical protein